MKKKIYICFQFQNDLLDYYNTIGSVPGKSGSDIQEGKCSWVAVAVLEKCNPEQRRIFTENYGSRNPEKVDRILRLYEELDPRKIYEAEEKARYDTFHRKVNALPKDAVLSAEFFKNFYNLIREYTQDTSTLMYDKYPTNAWRIELFYNKSDRKDKGRKSFYSIFILF